jgi:hypothetical protein
VSTKLVQLPLPIAALVSMPQRVGKPHPQMPVSETNKHIQKL